MQCRVSSPFLNWEATLGKTSLQSFSSLRRGEFLSRGGENALIDVCSRLRTDNSKAFENYLTKEHPRQRKYVVHWRIHWERTPSHDEKRAATTDGPLRAFLSTLSLFLSRGRKIYELVCARMRTKMHDRNHVNAFSRTNDRATHSGSLHRERETTNPASLYSASRGNDFLTENYSIKLGNNSVKRMNYYCPWIVKIIIMVIELCRVKWNQIQYRI